MLDVSLGGVPEPVVSQLVKPHGQDVHEESTEELDPGQSAGVPLTRVPLLVLKGHMGIVHVQDPGVGDGDTEGIAGQIVDDRCSGPAVVLAERAPGLLPGLRWQATESGGPGLLEGVPKPGRDQLGEGLDRDQECSRRFAPRLPIVADPATNRAMWDVQFFLDIGVITASTQLAPVGFDGTYWYAPEWSSATIHQFDKDGANHATFTIPGATSIRDIEYDGTYFYGGNAAGLFIWQMDFTAHTLVSTITLPVAARSCAYDADNDGFWVNVWTTDLICFSRTGTELNRITAPESLYGCAWDGTTQISGYDGPFLWVSTGTSSGVDLILKCYDIATKALTTTTHNVAQELGLGIAGGLITTPDYEAGTLTLAGCCQATSDYIFAYEVSITNAPPATPGARR